MVLTIQRDDVVRGGLGLGVRAVAASSWPTAAARGGTGRRRRALMVVAQGLHANRATAMLMGRREGGRVLAKEGAGAMLGARGGARQKEQLRRWLRGGGGATGRLGQRDQALEAQAMESRRSWLH